MTVSMSSAFTSASFVFGSGSVVCDVDAGVEGEGAAPLPSSVEVPGVVDADTEGSSLITPTRGRAGSSVRAFLTLRCRSTTAADAFGSSYTLRA